MSIIAWIVIGLIAGALARFLVPGRDPMGWFGTLILGLVGSLVGGLVGDALTAGDQDLSPAGLIGSILGAIAVLLVHRAAMSEEAWKMAVRSGAPPSPLHAGPHVTPGG